MYQVDDRDLVVEIADLPQSDIGAPLPGIFATENQTFLAYYLSGPPDDWDGTWVRVVGHTDEVLPVAVITFEWCYAHMFGPPNDEAFAGHPLADRGLHPYGVFEVRNSSWLRALERMNSVHPHHRADSFMQYKHFVFAFHDSTFECLAKGYACEVRSGSIATVLETMAKTIE